MVKMVITFKRRPGMSHQAFRDYRREVHAPMLLAIPEAGLIRRFVVTYPLLASDTAEPAWDAMVQAWFDDLDGLDGLFSSRNFAERVDPDHVNFIDLSTIRREVTEEVLVVG